MFAVTAQISIPNSHGALLDGSKVSWTSLAHFRLRRLYLISPEIITLYFWAIQLNVMILLFAIPCVLESAWCDCPRSDPRGGAPWPPRTGRATVKHTLQVDDRSGRGLRKRCREGLVLYDCLWILPSSQVSVNALPCFVVGAVVVECLGWLSSPQILKPHGLVAVQVTDFTFPPAPICLKTDCS